MRGGLGIMAAALALVAMPAGAQVRTVDPNQAGAMATTHPVTPPVQSAPPAEDEAPPPSSQAEPAPPPGVRPLPPGGGLLSVLAVERYRPLRLNLVDRWHRR